MGSGPSTSETKAMKRQRLEEKKRLLENKAKLAEDKAVAASPNAGRKQLLSKNMMQTLKNKAGR